MIGKETDVEVVLNHSDQYGWLTEPMLTKGHRGSGMDRIYRISSKKHLLLLMVNKEHRILLRSLVVVLIRDHLNLLSLLDILEHLLPVNKIRAMNMNPTSLIFSILLVRTV